jgi:hypothetical protein
MHAKDIVVKDVAAADPKAVQEQAEVAGIDQGLDVAKAMQEAQVAQEQSAADAVAAREFTTPDATYSRGVEGANVNTAIPASAADAPLISTYEDALEAGYLGVAAGHHNTEKLSVAAVTERDRRLGLPGTKGLKGAVVNKASDSPDAAAQKPK